MQNIELLPELLLAKYKEKRSEKNLTNQQISKLSYINISTVNSIFAGKVKSPSLITTAALCHILDISLDELCGLTSPDMPKEEIERILAESNGREEVLKKSVEMQMDLLEKSETERLHKEEIIELKDRAIEGLEKRNADLSKRIDSQVIVINIFRVWILALHIYGLMMDSMDPNAGLIRFPLWDILKANGWSVTGVIAIAIAVYLIIFWITQNIGKNHSK